jgi:signal transduction histidine kinase
VGQLVSFALDELRLVKELEQANRLKSDFVSAVSHDLRTPLNVIIGYSRLLLDDALGPTNPDQKEALAGIDTHAIELLELIDATLAAARLATGDLPLNVEKVSLPEFVREIAVEVRPLWEGSPVRLQFDAPATLPIIDTDRVKLKIILKNLIGNAIKFTPQGSVTVAVCYVRGGVSFDVSDTGIGISEEAKEAIFEQFRQADNSISDRYGGVGLGLYITKRTLDLMSGTINVESKPGQGSTFRVWVPASIGA